MSVHDDMLREAAGQMRALASQAHEVRRAPWESRYRRDGEPLGPVISDNAMLVSDSLFAPRVTPHIAAWDPRMASLTADLTLAVADMPWCCDECKYAPDNENTVVEAAVAVAAAFLGREVPAS